MREISADECISVLECALGEVQSVIPDEVLHAAIGYIEEYKILRREISWREWDVGRI